MHIKDLPPSNCIENKRNKNETNKNKQLQRQLTGSYYEELKWFHDGQGRTHLMINIMREICAVIDCLRTNLVRSGFKSFKNK